MVQSQHLLMIHQRKDDQQLNQCWSDSENQTAFYNATRHKWQAEEQTEDTTPDQPGIGGIPIWHGPPVAAKIAEAAKLAHDPGDDEYHQRPDYARGKRHR